MGALEDDLDYGLTVIRQRNYKSHTLADDKARWDDRLCTTCNREGGVALSFNACAPVPAPAKLEMTVAEVIHKLGEYNPNAKFMTVVKGYPQPHEFTYGSSDGCTKETCDDVCLMVGPQTFERN